MTPIVETTAGRVQGFPTDGVVEFLGIPYGASTAARARFQPSLRRDRPMNRSADPRAERRGAA
jgi:carboxylesterase type B